MTVYAIVELVDGITDDTAACMLRNIQSEADAIGDSATLCAGNSGAGVRITCHTPDAGPDPDGAALGMLANDIGDMLSRFDYPVDAVISETAVRVFLAAVRAGL